MKRFLLFFAAVLVAGMGFAKTITVGAQKPAEWDAMYLHYWNTSMGSTEWPGVQVNPDSLGWCYFTFNNDSVVNYIWNNGNGTQTGDLITRESVCQTLMPPQPHLGSGHYEAVLTDCGPIVPVNPDTTSLQPTSITLGFQAPVEWDSVYIYYWNTSLGNIGWPGVPLSQDSLGWSYFTFPNDQVVNYIWNNGRSGSGANQTVDLTANCSKCERVGGTAPNGNLVISFAECGSPRPEQPDTTQHDTITPQPHEPITIRMMASSVADAGWQKLYLYAWNGDNQPLGVWPGTALVADNGWYSYTFTDFDTINLVWNDAINTHAQTLNFEGVTASECYALGDSLGYGTPNRYYDCQAIDCNTPIDTIPDPVPNVGITIKLAASSVPESWEQVYILSWTPGVDSLVSTGYGALLTADSSGWYSYTFPAGVEPIDFLFDNGAWNAGNQTEDTRAYVSTCYGFGEPDETTYFKFPFLLADCLTGEIFPEVGDTSSHMVYIWDNISRIYWDSIEVPFGGDVTLPTQLPEYEGYHFVFWEGLYDGSNVLYNVRTDQYMQAKYYINLPEEPAQNPVTVRLKASTVPESWEHVYVFSWTEGAEVNVWPGIEMQMDDNGWYTHTFPEGIQDIDFLFDNGDGNVGNQTVDVDNVNADYCFQIGAPLTFNGFYLVYPADCNEIDPQPEDTTGILIRFFSPENFRWDRTKYLYAWQSNDSVDTPILGEWPGQEMAYDSLTDWFYCRVPSEYTNFNIVINAASGYKSNQTVDIMGIEEDMCFGIGNYAHENYNDMRHFNYEVLDCERSGFDYHRVLFLDAEGFVYEYANVLHGDSLTPPAGPAHHGYIFTGWDQDLSCITSDLFVYPLYEEEPATSNLEVRLLPTDGFGWGDIYLYAWAYDENGNVSEILDGWPGIYVPKDSLGWHSYTFHHDSIVNILWHDGTKLGGVHQTQDILNVSESTCYRLLGRDSIHQIAEPIDCGVNLADYRTIAFYDYNLMMVNQQPVGSRIEVLPDEPTAPEGSYFMFWADYDMIPADSIVVTENTIIYAWFFRNEYPVYILDGLDGSLIDSIIVEYGQSVDLSNIIPYHEGYEFAGWTNELNNVTETSFTIAKFRPIAEGNYTVTYSGKDGEFLDSHTVSLDVPVPPVYDGFTFVGWQVVGGDLENGIQVQAVYQEIGTDAPEVREGRGAVRKVIRDSKVFIITPNGKVFSSDGKFVKEER